MKLAGKRMIEAVAWALLSAAIVYFFVRDVPPYATYTPDSYGSYWANRGYLIPHVVGAGVAILVGLSQFSTTIRQRWPAIHARSRRGCGGCHPALKTFVLDEIEKTLTSLEVPPSEETPSAELSRTKSRIQDGWKFKWLAQSLAI